MVQIPGSDIKPWLCGPPRSYLFTNANIVDVQDGIILKNSSLVAHQGKIQSIFSSSSPLPENLPKDLTIVDCQGVTSAPVCSMPTSTPAPSPASMTYPRHLATPTTSNCYVNPITLPRCCTAASSVFATVAGAQLALNEAIDDGVPQNAALAMATTTSAACATAYPNAWPPCARKSAAARTLSKSWDLAV